MSYTAAEKRLIQEYLEDHPYDELNPELPATQAHHIFGKWADELRNTKANLVALSASTHHAVEFSNLQELTNKICDLKIKTDGQKFIDLANKYGGKMWRIYRESVRDMWVETLTNTDKTV